MEDKDKVLYTSGNKTGYIKIYTDELYDDDDIIESKDGMGYIGSPEKSASSAKTGAIVAMVLSSVLGGAAEAALYYGFNPINPQAGYFYNASRAAATSIIPFGVGTAVIGVTVAAIVIRSIYVLCTINKAENSTER